jgi:hypothetical protein
MLLHCGRIGAKGKRLPKEIFSTGTGGGGVTILIACEALDVTAKKRI